LSTSNPTSDPVRNPPATDEPVSDLVRRMDWSRTLLGPVASWSPTLRSMVPFLLANRFPMLLWWGPDYVQIYNEAYRPILGSKHPRAMGQPVRECWAEIMDIIGPLIDTPYHGGPSTWMEDLALEVNRHGFFEETHFTVAYSPVPDEAAASGIGGVLATVHEITDKVVGERRVRLLRDLGASAKDVKSAEEACSAAASEMERYPKDLPFALIYLIDPKTPTRAHLACAIGVEPGEPASPTTIDLGSSGAAWPLAEALRGDPEIEVSNLSDRFASVPTGPWSDPPDRAVIRRIQSSTAQKPAGLFVAGLSPRLRYDESYRSFLELANGQIAIAIANARAYEEERRRAESLAELDRAKTAFFSNVSHEFRTPLTLMLGPLEESLERIDIDPEERARLDTVHRNGLRLLRLVNTLLEFSRIEAGRARAAYRATRLPELTAELASAFRSAVERAGLELLVHCPPQDEVAWVDPEMWEKIVLNLVSNAFKFTLHGFIEVRLEQVDASWSLTVRDTGIGIPESDQAKVFDRFHRVEGARGRSYEGSGIGLALVRELVRLNGGRITVTSEVGRGTTFTVTIPRGKEHFHEDPEVRQEVVSAAEVARAFVEEALRWLPDSGAVALLPEPPAVKAGVAKPRILLADDNADLRDYVRRLLAPNYDVESVADGQAALESVRAHPPDLVIADVMMPRMDGIELVRELRGDAATHGVPIVLLSARAGEESRIEGLKLGADDYLVKPFSARELLARVGARIAETARRGAETRVRDVLDTITDGFAAFDAEGRFVYVNPAMRRIWAELGMSYDVIGKPLYEAFPATRDDEFGRAYERARAFRMPVEIEAYHEAFERWLLVRYFPSSDGGVLAFTQDVTTRKQAEVRVREEDRRKDEFLATLAHEMRNPLAPIRNSIAVLNSFGTEAPEAQWARDVIDRQVGNMARLLDDLLDVSRIARNRLELRRERFPLAQVVRRSLEVSQPLIDAAGHVLSVSLPEEDLWVDADPLRLSQVLSNLLNNAAKYTPRGGKIAVRARREDDEVVISVRDTGIGIPRELLPRVFDIFVQATPALDRTEPGLGIGLSLVRGIVEAHGGRVQAKSGGAGTGSEFLVRLALATPAPEQRTAEPSAGALPGSVKRVLVADDNVDSGDTLAQMLRLAGHEVHVVRDGVQAVRALAQFRPDVAVLDIGMPGMNGYEAARLIRAQEGGWDVVLVALTGWGQREDRDRALRAGFDLHLVKPMDTAALDELLRRIRSEAGVNEAEPTAAGPSPAANGNP